MREFLIAGVLLAAAVPLLAREEASEPPQVRDYSRERLRSIFLGVEAEPEEARDPFKDGLKLFEFEIGNSRTTVRFNPFMVPLGGGRGIQINPIVNPLDMTGTAGSSLSPRLRNRYSEWWISRKLGFPLSPPSED